MDGLVDLSLFAESPSNDHYFASPEPRTCHDYDEQPLWSGHGPMAHSQRPACCTMKPLPPLPRRPFIQVGCDPRRFDGPSRCILLRLRRSKSDRYVESPAHYGDVDRSAYYTNTIQQRRHATPAHQLTLPEPQPHQAQCRTASPMVWLADEQIWLVVDDHGPHNPHRERHGQHPHRQYRDSPRSARSEPSPRHSDFSPVRTQFMTLVGSRDDDERLSPLFQEAIHGVSMHEYGDSNEPPTFQTERDWRAGRTTGRATSAQSANVEISPVDFSYDRSPPYWADLGWKIDRPSSVT
ncbi:hypothetical protein MMC19_006733 [Ptychographa xylographoides]|nr:hypothetical protein [Ptychographa xylographoides]